MGSVRAAWITGVNDDIRAQYMSGQSASEPCPSRTPLGAYAALRECSKVSRSTRSTCGPGTAGLT
jgi:hypothetical protein